ncbi:hypothetical protein PSI64_003009 [Escherichia coli]|nr:hypothetical protein [Escherichia coli]
MTNISAVEKMAELMQQMEENSPRVAALQYCLSEVSKRITELEQKLAESQREFRAADATIENLQMQVEKMAAENAGLKNALEWLYEAVSMPDSGPIPDKYYSAVTNAAAVMHETPAADAFLAEVRAQGVEAFASVLEARGKHHEYVEIANAYAALLRKGVQS